MPEKIPYRVGDSVVVKQGVTDPDDPKWSLAGWQGQVVELYPDVGTVLIRWDSPSIEVIPDVYIRECEIGGFDYERMGLDHRDVEPAAPRDQPDDIERVSKARGSHHRWDHLADENPGISELLGDLEDDDEAACLNAWATHLANSLKFPFEAKIQERTIYGRFRVGDRVKVMGISSVDEMHGLLANVRHGREHATVAMCDMEATDAESSNYQPLNDYVVWFANR